MFSKSKIPEKKSETTTSADKKLETNKPVSTSGPAPAPASTSTPLPSTPSPMAPKTKPAASILSSDLQIKGNLNTSGDIQIDCEINGDVRAHLLTIGEKAQIKGEVIADDVVVNGHVAGTVRGLKVRLTSTSRVEGDIIHKTIAIESGAHFEGSVRREEDPLSAAKTIIKAAPNAS